jgi:hypothetical protein
MPCNSVYLDALSCTLLFSSSSQTLATFQLCSKVGSKCDLTSF